MSTVPDASGLDEQIGQWRTFMARRRAVHAADVDELEDHLRSTIDELTGAGLRPDEAFLVAVKRMGGQDELSGEFAREHSDRLWKQLVAPAAPDAGIRARTRWELLVALGTAVGAFATFGLFYLLGFDPDDDAEAYLRNFGVLTLPWLTAYFAWKRRLSWKASAVLMTCFAAAAVLANVYPFEAGAHTSALMILHLPIVLWLVVGVAYARGQWRSHTARMDYVRFTGEWVIYYGLIAIGGVVLTALTLAIFGAIGIEPPAALVSWALWACAAGAAVVSAWLVEAKQSVIENMAPVLTRVFTPLLAVMLLSFLVAIGWTGRGVSTDREVLIIIDIVLVFVLGLLLYSISARDPQAPPSLFDRLNLVLVGSAIAVDVLVLAAVLDRISDFGPSANKVAAVGENAVLLVNLVWSAWLLIGLLRRQTPFSRLERWQTAYLPVYGLWALIVVVVFPPLFGYV